MRHKMAPFGGGLAAKWGAATVQTLSKPKRHHAEATVAFPVCLVVSYRAMQFEYQTDQLLINKFVFWDDADRFASRRASVHSLPSATKEPPDKKARSRTVSTSKLNRANGNVIYDANGNVPKDFRRSLLVRKSQPAAPPKQTSKVSSASQNVTNTDGFATASALRSPSYIAATRSKPTIPSFDFDTPPLPTKPIPSPRSKTPTEPGHTTPTTQPRSKTPTEPGHTTPTTQPRSKTPTERGSTTPTIQPRPKTPTSPSPVTSTQPRPKTPTSPSPVSNTLSRSKTPTPTSQATKNQPRTQVPTSPSPVSFTQQRPKTTTSISSVSYTDLRSKTPTSPASQSNTQQRTPSTFTSSIEIPIFPSPPTSRKPTPISDSYSPSTKTELPVLTFSSPPTGRGPTVPPKPTTQKPSQPFRPSVSPSPPSTPRSTTVEITYHSTPPTPPSSVSSPPSFRRPGSSPSTRPPIPLSTSKTSKTTGTLGKTYCQSCGKKCSGEVLRVQDKYFHIACFKCKVCRNSLAQGGFFCKDGGYYCTNDYQRQFGTKCAVCNEYVEGEVVSALGSTYHQKCFTCGRCRQAFPSGERVTYTGKEVLCAKCVQIPIRETISTQHQSNQSSPTSAGGGNECAGCHEELKDCQALIALDRQWHIWCFKCKSCDVVLHGEYMGKDGVPFCEKDYQAKFGVKCAYCNRYISGKVLQAGEDHHFHPTCARCTKCGDPFGDGEEMYLQGGAIWHPRCGPGPTESGTVLNGSGIENGHCTDTETEAESGRDTAFDRISSSAVSDMQFSIRSRTPSFNGSCNSLSRKYPGGAYHRTGSPGLVLREYRQHYPEDIFRIYTYSYLTEEPTQGYLRRPIDPYDKPPTSPHFHRPFSAQSGRSSKLAGMSKHGSRSGMAALVDSIRSETPRPRSPHMNNEEPIELAHFPGARPPPPGEPPKIEREDFPAPPYPYSDPERRRRWSDSYKGLPMSDDEDETDAKEKEKAAEDKRLKKEEQELSKIATGIGKVFLQNVREREKLRQWKMSNMDPRNASRTPSAAKEPAYRLRYESPVNASPSRNVDHPRPWEEDEMLDRSSSYRSSVGRSVGAIPSYNVVSSLRAPPKPGYGLRSSTLPAAGRNGGHIGYSLDQGDFSFSGLGEKTHSTELSSGKSDMSAGSISEVDRRAMNTELPVSTTYAAGLGALRSSSYSPHLRRSLPNMAHSSTDPPKVYPYHLLVITNYRLPSDVDRCNLERHLSDAEFDALFGCSRVDFYRLPQWRRNDMKRRVRLF